MIGDLNNPAFVIMTWLSKDRTLMMERNAVSSFADAIAAGLPLDADHAQLLLDAYGKHSPDLALVARAVKLTVTGRIATDDAPDPFITLDAIATAHWQKMDMDAGFLRMHAALYVGGHSERWANAVAKTKSLPTDFISSERISAATAIT